MNYFQIGKIVKAHGLKGYVKVYPITDFPERFSKEEIIYQYTHNEYQRIVIEDVVDTGKDVFLVKFEGVDSVEAAELMKNQYLYIDESQLYQLDEGEYYHHDLIACEVFTEEGVLIGVLEDIVEMPAHDVYIVKTGDGEVMIPAVKRIVKNVDIKNKKIVLNPVEGLLEI